MNMPIFPDNNQTLVSQFNDLLKAEGQSSKTLEAFSAIIKNHYQNYGRVFAWRKNITPYSVVVSEIMLQQTQTDRVAQKFDLFLTRFPDFATLANAPFDELIRTWKGLGYNRRAIALQKIAQKVVTEFDGALPNNPEILVTFPGIGKATASSITAFAFNKPTVFIETNIRTVFIYFFFKNQINIHDKDIMPLVEKTVDQHNPREWYYALMDYGVLLKKQVGNLSRLSTHYTKQSKFEGSDRQIRGKILQLLLDYPMLDSAQIIELLKKEEQRVLKIIQTLDQEGFICQTPQGFITLAKREFDHDLA